jgi:hypothetical protein
MHATLRMASNLFQRKRLSPQERPEKQWKGSVWLTLFCRDASAVHEHRRRLYVAVQRTSEQVSAHR